MAYRASARGIGRAFTACLVAGLVLCAGGFGPASAEDDDELWDVKAFRGIMRGLGMQRGDESNIDYHERSPLVVPPTSNLPPPENPAFAERNPNWPVDPDISRRKEVAARKKKAIDWEEEGRALTPQQLDKDVPRAGPSSTAATVKTAEESARPSTPTELGVKGFEKGFESWRSLLGFEPKEEVARFEQEPRRTQLTQPPPGYLTPSASQPYGFNKSKQAPTTGPVEVDQAVGQTR